ncbi:OmpP1/FadL family transporter [Litoribacter populi]|uniref:OmpP1/FadL family transporter n=1 Tax=Litoribacter populi TaxID=2598460 RepID=UPI00117F28B8|nr:outer membrane protein transport protein [Litoribacter populi]
MKSINKWILGIAALSLLGTESSMAQSGYYQDALRFSQFTSTGSARVMGLAGTQYSLGGDISNIHGNAAGLGFFRRSEFSISPSYGGWNTDSYLDNASEFGNIPTTNFALPNLSLVIANPRDPLTPGAFKGGTFGVSINRTANFNSEFAFRNITPTSLTEYFAADAFGVAGTILDQENSLRGLAYSTALIAPTVIDGTEYFPTNNTQPLLYEEVVTEGGITQVTFAYGANFEHKLFIGGSLGVSSINYSQFKYFTEDFDTQFGDMVGYDLRENLFINGTGVNLNLGAIYKPVDALNLGLNFQSPTWYRLNEEYDANIISEFVNPTETFDARTDILLSTYNLRSPMKFNAGATYFLGKNGFISADVDYVDYSTMFLNSRDFNPQLDNMAIQQTYGQTFNFRGGGEYRYEMFRVRAGYAYYGDPFDDPNSERFQTVISGGIGVRLPKFYIDLGINHTQFDQTYRSYSLIDAAGRQLGPVADIRNTITSGILTVGFNF